MKKVKISKLQVDASKAGTREYKKMIKKDDSWEFNFYKTSFVWVEGFIAGAMWKKKKKVSR